MLQTYIDHLLLENNIKVVKWSRGTNGRAWIKQRAVKIPKATSAERFCIALHEIAHVKFGWSKRVMPLYLSEYLCEQWAIETAKKFGVNTAFYEQRAKGYVTMCIAKGYCRRLNLDNVPVEIKKWCGVDFESWKGYKVFVSGWSKGQINVVKNPLTQTQNYSVISPCS